MPDDIRVILPFTPDIRETDSDKGHTYTTYCRICKQRVVQRVLTREQYIAFQDPEDVGRRAAVEEDAGLFEAHLDRAHPEIFGGSDIEN